MELEPVYTLAEVRAGLLTALVLGILIGVLLTAGAAYRAGRRSIGRPTLDELVDLTRTDLDRGDW